MPLDILGQLNERQARAARAHEGGTRVIAGPGTGKTRALTARYCFLVDELGTPPSNILSVTFTNRAANEMKKRIRRYLGDGLDLAYISTIHSFCRLFLREEIFALGLDGEFEILDSVDQQDLLAKIFGEMGISRELMTIKKAQDDILEGRKIDTRYLDYFTLADNEKIKELYASGLADVEEEIFLRYLYEQKKNWRLDFNDLINFTLHLLKNNEKTLRKWSEKMNYVMVDEFQDVSQKQYEVVSLLASHHRNFFIVGDLDQTIYSWRGSHRKLFDRILLEFGGTETIVLAENYRSTPEILAAADALIKNNSDRLDKELLATLPSGEKPLYFNGDDAKEEAGWIAQEILKKREAGANLKDISVLVRAAHLTRNLEEAFFKAQIPYRVFAGVEFYKRAEIKDIIAYLRLVTKGDDLSFLRTIKTPPKGIGDKTLQRIKSRADARSITLFEALRDLCQEDLKLRQKAAAFILAVDELRRAKDALALDDFLQSVLDRFGYEEYLRTRNNDRELSNLGELKSVIKEYAEDGENTLGDFLSQAALFSDLDNDRKNEGVSVMTIHSAKGLEYGTVFICGLNENIFPSQHVQTIEELEEERRILYVAMTRAKKSLFLSSAEGFTNDNLRREPSRFLYEIADLVSGAREKDVSRISSERRPRFRLLRPSDDALFPVGARVEHPHFGLGAVVMVDEKQGKYFIKFDEIDSVRAFSFTANLKLREETEVV
ncbi:MAG: UvrD-helicase domain-containing protein [Deltaproteobacteria bacterium]|jgi:DNA helicase-2/ATP-dependent DNA helicase PcrA|nr:UvrD-helicase domain-containing protein [Deltaproteobacteria bacterium]